MDIDVQKQANTFKLRRRQAALGHATVLAWPRLNLPTVADSRHEQCQGSMYHCSHAYTHHSLPSHATKRTLAFRIP